jgi:uncharacterized protein (DUF58 family)
VPVPTRRLAVVAAALSVALLLIPGGGFVELAAVDAILLVVALGDWALATSPSAVDVRRSHPPVITVGAEGTLHWEISNPTERRLRVAVADELAPSLAATTRRLHVTLPPHGRARVRTSFRPARRGRFTVVELVVRVDGPLGLGARQAARRQPTTIRVYPPFRSREEAELRIDRARILEVGLRSAQGRGGGTEFEQLREYTPDDEFRRVDWSATARTGRAIVRTYRAERNQNVVVLLDNGRVMAGRVAGVPRVEHAMDAAMMVTVVASRLGDRCGLVAFDRRVRAVVAPGKGTAQLGRVTAAMYDLEPELAESDYRGAFVETVARFRRRALLVVLTDLVDQAMAEFLLPALPLIVRSHVVLVGAVRDPEVAGWVTAPARDADEAYRKVAAVAAVEERERAVARLRALGATVVDAPPGRLAPDLADAYLHMKATGRL